MGYRPDVDGLGMALSCDKTTTGARLIASIPVNQVNIMGFGVIRLGDSTTPCPKCGKAGKVIESAKAYRRSFMGIQVAVDRCEVMCDCPQGSNRIIAPSGQWMGSGPSPAQIAQEKHAAMLLVRQAEKEAQEKRLAEERERNRVFAKSCLRGEGCNDAGEEQEPHTNFAVMAFYQAAPPADPVSDNVVVQHAQSARKKKSAENIPEPKKRSALYKWWFGNHEEMDYQAAKDAAERAENAKAAVADASVLGLIGGSAITSGTWAVKFGEMATGLGRIAASGPGAPLVAVVMGMMPGRLNDGEQDFLDRMRLEQMREAPTRVRYTWESDSQGNLVPHGWHTPPGKDRVRVRKMEWNHTRKAYTFTTEEDPPITIVWTPDNTGENNSWNTGNQNPVRIPNPVVVDPLAEDTSIEATTTPAPEEKKFADYILILPLPNIPPIHVYLHSVLKGNVAEEAAKKLGYNRRVAPNKAPFNSHGQPAFFNGKDYITPDVDGHNVSEGWKKFSKKGVRLSTYDKYLNRVKG
ncbi:S-type pyocin domain-containing protein [Tenebrionibacter intestinalis]|uniref:S-type pyocin domain-containing protein n=1 Tax=Tenebrionibacter intestinalis TaxID=2799638 RepID=A0A8K0V737_9ENTR|nr:S-type pyocin domain-containing protein [Tenebrionibacter intestinalis]MBK4717051.1 S-type pyocin domain-containing protein [Tenebrionibacter intestinalis]